MAVSERKRQEKLARKEARRKAKREEHKRALQGSPAASGQGMTAEEQLDLATHSHTRGY